jgi:hypothetical protein
MYDHEIEIDGEIKRLEIIKDNDGTSMYHIAEQIPEYRNPLKFIQDNWIGGHGQYDFNVRDKYFEGQSIDTTLDGRLILGPEIMEVKENDASNIEAPVMFCWYPTCANFYCATAAKVYVYDATNVDFVAMNASPANCTDMKVHNKILYLARGSAGAYQWSDDGTDFQATDLTTNVITKFMTAPNPAGTSDVLWGAKLPNELYSTTDGRSAANSGVEWSSAAYIGDTASNINNIILINDNLLIGREDGLYHYDSAGGTHQLMPDLRWVRSSDNFKYITDWQTGIYFSLLRGMGEITSYNSYEPMGPLTLIDDIGKLGDVVGLASDRDFIYAAIDEGTNTIIYKCRERRTSQGLRWEYCPFVFLGTNSCNALAVCQHSSTDRRLWFGYGNNAAYVKLSDNPLADSNFRYCANGWLRTSYEKGSNPYFGQIWQTVITQTNGCTVNQTVTIKYRENTEANATTATDTIVSNGVNKTDFYSPVNCERIQFELHLASAVNTASPQVSYFEVQGTEQPTCVRTHEVVYKLGDTPTKRSKTIRDFFRKGRTSKTFIKFADLRYKESVTGDYPNDFVYCVMETGYPQEIEIKQDKTKQPEIGIKVRLREIDYGG